MRMQHEIKTLRAIVDTQEEAIKTLTSAKERIEKEKYKLEKELLAYKMREKDGVLVDGDSEGKMDCILHLRGKTSITIVLITTFFPCFHN